MTKTDAELRDALATEVMGWHIIRAGQPFRDGVIPLNYDAWFDAENKIVMAVDEFDPLHDHNHMAIPRTKMREMGLFRTAFDKGNGQIEISYCNIKCMQRGIATDTNELRAEGFAMIEAAGKEAK